MNERQVIVTIAYRPYPLRLSSSEEKFVKQAEEKIDKLISELERNYGVKDRQDLLAMCLLQMTTDFEKHNEEHLQFVKEAEEKSQKLINGINEYINSTIVL